jgi:GTP:adenosylcobinamide-phosphate guanylyltransferase
MAMQKNLVHIFNTNLEIYLNPLNAELNSIFHLLVLFGDLMFMVPCIVSIFQYTCISNKTQRYTVYLYLETAVHVLGGTSTHHQKHIQLYLQHLVFVTPLLLSAAIVKELEPV